MQSLSAQAPRSPITNVGIGLRSVHYQYIEETTPVIPWFEVLIDNYLGKGGTIRKHLLRIRENYPVTFHGVGMSLGSTDPLNINYLKLLRQAIDEYEPVHISDHLCWTGVASQYLHELMPVPYTDEAAKHIADRIRQVQDFLGQRILVENVSSYMEYTASCYTEAEFLSYVIELADCDLLLDINNIHVSAFNHNFNAQDYLQQIPGQRIREIHLAGYEEQGDMLLDTHSEAVHEPVWELYEKAINQFGAVPTLIEWDNAIPALDVLLQEAHKAQTIMDRCHAHAA